jgi:hypothetical protein
MFPGAVNLAIIFYSCVPRLVQNGLRHVPGVAHLISGHGSVGPMILLIYIWLTASMAIAWLAKVAEPHRFGRLLSLLVVYIVGYGSLLCACTFASYVKELRKADMTWDKTEKTGKVAIPG